MKIVICICTYKRPRELGRLLLGINRMGFTMNEVPDVEIFVTDNSKLKEGARICDEMRSELKWPIRYCHEPKPGIAYARNKGLSLVGRDIDFVAFIDDDEEPDFRWLDELLYVQKLYDADVVTGYVMRRFEEPAPSWIYEGGFFNARRYPTGYCVGWAGTNNSMVRKSIFDNKEFWFDERFALSGGEDAHLFFELKRAGFKIVWADNAVVYDWVPPHRTTMRYLLMRRYSCETINFRVGLPLKRKVFFILEIFKYLFLGFYLMVKSLFKGKSVFVSGGICLAIVAGRIAGLLGFPYLRYDRTAET